MISLTSYGQGKLSGSLNLKSYFFVRDSSIGAFGTPQYDHQFFGLNSWTNINYENAGFDLGIRYDLFNQSFLFDPQGSYSEMGLGNWYLKKSVDALDIHVGHIYHQMGSGLIFRSYEDRNIGIDNALIGLKLTYNFTEDFSITALGGKQKDRFSSYASTLKGLELNYFHQNEGKDYAYSGGFGTMINTLDEASINTILATVNIYQSRDQFVPKYNILGLNTYHNFRFKNLSIGIDGAYKSNDAFINPMGTRKDGNGNTIEGPKLTQKKGWAILTNLSYSVGSFAFQVDYRKNENFDFSINPFAHPLRGKINFLPPLTRINANRLTSMHVPATQYLGENTGSLNLYYTLDDKTTFHWNFSNSSDKQDQLLYNEVYFDIQSYFDNGNFLNVGIQYQNYNIAVYEAEPQEPPVKTLTIKTEFTQLISPKKSLRIELAHSYTRQFRGDWVYGLIEYSVSPKWVFSINDTWNYSPLVGKGLHYYQAGFNYLKFANIFSLNYVRREDGINCSGGICRYEPAFNGVQFTLQSSF